MVRGTLTHALLITASHIFSRPARLVGGERAVSSRCWFGYLRRPFTPTSQGPYRNHAFPPRRHGDRGRLLSRWTHHRHGEPRWHGEPLGSRERQRAGSLPGPHRRGAGSRLHTWRRRLDLRRRRWHRASLARPASAVDRSAFDWRRNTAFSFQPRGSASGR